MRKLSFETIFLIVSGLSIIVIVLFISSMINRRLLKQLEELKQYPRYFLIIEGIEEQELYNDDNNIEGKREHPYAISPEAIRNRLSEFRGKSKKTRGLSSNSIRGMLLSIILKYQIPIIFTKNAEDTAQFLYVLVNRLKKPEQELSLNPKKRAASKKEQKQFILESFPGIGPATAKKLLKEFKSIKGVINSPIEELQKIIGKKAEIFKLVEEKY